jgi:hypothetical protein
VCPPEHLSTTRLRYAPRWARGGYTLRAPRSQGWSGAALLVLGLDTRRRMGEGSVAGVLKISGTVRFQRRLLALDALSAAVLR